MKKNIFLQTFFLVVAVFLLAPNHFLFAVSPTIQSLIIAVGNLLNQIIPFIIGLGLVIFLFGIIKYMTAGGGEDKTAARNLMIYGVVALFVMVSVWGLVGFLQVALFGVSGSNALMIGAPSIPSDFYSGPGQSGFSGTGGSSSGGSGSTGYNPGSPFGGTGGGSGGGGGGAGGSPPTTVHQVYQY